MKTPIVFDSSALLAIAFDESGAEAAQSSLGEGIMSAVNASEVVGRFVDLGLGRLQAQEWLLRYGIPIFAFDEASAIAAGALRGATRSAGLSLGDRACIALARRESGSVITADRNWARLDLGVFVSLIR